MSGWRIDVVGLHSLLGSLDVEVGDARSAVTDIEDALDRIGTALAGPVAAAYGTFVSDRREAPREVVTTCDLAATAAVQAAAALAAGNVEMAEQQRLARVSSDGTWLFPGTTSGAPQPW